MAGPWDQYAKQPTDVQKPGGPWQKYQAPPAAAADPTAGPVAGAGPLGVPQLAAHEPVSMQSSLLSPSNYIDSAENAAKGLIKPLLHPVKSVMSYPGFVNPAAGGGPIQDVVNNPDKGKGFANAVADVGTGVAMGGLLSAPGAAKEFVRGNVDEPASGSTTTPRMRYDAAKRMGVNLDAADATGSSLLGNVKRVGENSLAGGHLYDASKAANTGAIRNFSDQLLDTMSPHNAEEGGKIVQEGLQAPFREIQSRLGDMKTEMYPEDRESGGRLIQSDLQANHADLKETGTKGFQKLTRETGNEPLPGSSALGASAKEILDEQEPYFERFPSLRPAKTMSVVEDVARLHNDPENPLEWDWERNKPVEDGADWATMHRLGTDLHGLYSSNPELTKTRPQSWLQGLVKQNADIVRDAGSGLSPEQRSIFEQANSAWANHKSTYDNPSSPFYHAVRTENPSTLFGTVGPKTAENAINLTNRLSPKGLGAMRAGTIEGALKPDMNGAPEMASFGSRFARLPADYRGQLFSPEQNAELNHIASDYDYHEPYAKAAFKTPAAEIVEGVGPKTAQNVRKLRGVIGDEAMGALQRGAAEKLLRTNREGDYNFPTFGRQLHLQPEDYRNELFGEHIPALNDLATTSNTLTKDFNPSGSAKQGQKIAEALAMVPTAGLPLLQHPVAKFMTSPRAVDWLMRPPQPSPFRAPVAGLLSSSSDDRRDDR